MKKRHVIIALMLMVTLITVSCASKDRTPSGPEPQDSSIDQPGTTGMQGEQKKNDDNKNQVKQGENADYGVYHGDKAYDFKLEDLEGNVVSLSDYKGKTVIVTFWQTTCSWCRKELPLFNKLYETYKDGDLVVLAVNIAEDKAKVAQVAKDEGFTFPVLLDGQAEVAKKYLISALPTSFIINGKGIISAVHIGYMEYSQMEAYVEAAFKEM
ncbi:MAG: hypothetical protein HPY66_0409 [Firmicutes bacterium]|nr:hypothetical protein [Bacillota bacterium]MDI6705107.1 TlpA disulfide reductase family protein [Bacillota bacterium]